MGPFTAQLLQRIRYHGLDERLPAAAQLRSLAEYGKLTEAQARMYLPWIDQQAQGLIDRPNFLHRPPEAEEFHADGEPEVQLGTLCEADVRFGVRLLDRPRHVLVAGDTGSGKTTAIRQLSYGIDQLRRQRGTRISQIVSDPKAGEYSDLPGAMGPHWLHLNVHDDGLRLGLNAPGMPPNIWINIVSRILAARLGLIASAVCLANLLRFLVATLNPEATDTPWWPDLRLVLEVLRRSPLGVWASKADYGKTLIQALEGIVQASGNLLCTFNGLDVNRDIIDQGKSLVIEMSNLEPPALRSIVVDLIIAQVLYPRLHRHHKVDTTEVVLVCDEADQDVSRDAEAAFPGGMSVISHLLKQGRELGIMAVLGLTLLGRASRYVLNGAQYHLIFNQPDAESMTEARRTLALPPAAEQMFPALRKGEGIFRQAQAEWAHPVLCQVDYFPPCRISKTGAYDTHPFVPSRTLDELPSVQAGLKELVARHYRAQLRQAQPHETGLSSDARQLLDLAALHPYTPVARQWDRLKKDSASVQRKARKELETSGLAEFEDVRIGRTTILLMEVLSGGWRLLNKPAPSRPGRGGLVHRHFSYWIEEVGRQRGYQGRREWIVPGTNHPVDVAWLIGARGHVFEVCVTCTDNLVSHLRTCLANPGAVERVTVVTSQKSTRSELERAVQSQLLLEPALGRVSFEVIEPFMKELFR